jgi:hypothetical protein
MSKGKSITGRRKQQGIYQERSGFSPWLQQYANLGADSNGGIWSGAIGRGAGFSNTQLAEMQFNHDESQLDRQFQEDMYNKYQSPEAQMRQYQAAGLNPALMYEGGVDINGPSGGSAASVSGAVGGDSPSNGFEQVMGIMSQFMNMITGASGIGSSVMDVVNKSKATNSTVALQNADIAKKEEETRGIKIDNERKQIQLAIDRAVQADVISQKQAEAFKAAWEADVLAGTPVEEATKNLLTKFGIDSAELDKKGSEAEKNRADADKASAEAELARGRNTRESAKNVADISLINKQLEVLETQKTLNGAEEELAKVNKTVQEQVQKSAAAKSFLDEYAKENNLPLGDYMAISLYRHYQLQYVDTKKKQYLRKMNDIRDLLHRNMGKDVNYTRKDFEKDLAKVVTTGIETGGKIITAAL